MPTFAVRGGSARLHYHDLPGRGGPLVFLHGMGCASSCDYPQVACAPALQGRRRVLLDLLGSGYSDRPADFDYTVRAHAQIVAEFIRALELHSVCLYGHSMSGAIAIVVARLLSDRVSRLVLSEPNLDPGGGTVSRVIAHQSLSRYVSSGHAAIIRAARRQGQHVWASTMALSFPIAIHREAVSLVKGSRPSWRKALANLPMPRIVLFGAQSLPDQDTIRLPTIGVRTIVVPRAGHGMAQDNPTGLALALAKAVDS
jgi:pimeloyl-ACP methyl ester carboxylesterase